MTLYEVQDDTGKLLGTVPADSYSEAAQSAAATFFKLPRYFRASGWHGQPGRFFACDGDERAIPFYLRVKI